MKWNRRNGWFHARKTRPIWARQLEASATIETLEGTEQVAAGDFLCRGEAGDLWAQTEANLLKRYRPVPDSPPSVEGWRKYEPLPDAAGVLAIAIDHRFVVEATWGTLHGKAGDYLVKNYGDRDVPFPEDLWIVDRTLFDQTYARVHD